MSLFCAIYKIISNVLANRMKSVLHGIINSSQSSFLRDRGLLENIVLANKVVKDLGKGKKSEIVIKVDCGKAYDFVCWDFLYYMLSRLGFCEKWVSWIRGCLESSLVSVLVNGSPSRECTPSRGLRQGDMITPFLFLVAVEGLEGLVRKVVRLKKMEGVIEGVNQIEVSLLQFADGTLVVC